MTLKTKILLLLFLGNLVGSLLFSFSTLSSHWEGAMRSLDFRLLRTAYTAAYFIGPDFHEALLPGHNPIPLDQHVKTTERLADIARMMGVRSVYALFSENGQVHVSASSAPKTGISGRFFDPWNLEFAYTTPLMKKAFTQDQINYEEGKDDLGTFRSVYLPQKTPSGHPFLIGADITLDSIHERLLELWKQYSLKGLLFFFIPFALVFVLLQKTSRHLMQLAEFTRQLVDQRFAPDKATIEGLKRLAGGYHDEVGLISSSLYNMHSALHKHIRELERTTAEKERMDSEIRIAYDIQRNILPRSFPPHCLTDQVEIFATLLPAAGVGGDFFDFTLLDDRQLLILAGDISGKGIPAALFMAVTTTLLKTYGQQHLSPDGILRAANADLERENERAMFATVFCGILDLTTGALNYAVAGHNPPVVLHSSGVTLLSSGGIPLGISDRPEFAIGTATLAPGELLALYTDGITEAWHSEKGFFTEERLLSLLGTCPRTSPDLVVSTLAGAVREFSGGQPQADDIMIMAIRRLPTEGLAEARDRLALTIRNSLDEYPRVNAFFEEAWRDRLLPPTLYHDFMVVLEESLSNVIKYAFPADVTANISINTEFVGGTIRLEIQDGGIPFNPLTHVRPPSDEEDPNTTTGGWGIHLVKKLAQTVDYQRRDNHNILRITMQLPSLTLSESGILDPMTMEIQEKLVDSVRVLSISGRIDTQTSSQLEEALEKAIDEGSTRFVFDFSALDYVTSGGLRVLLQHSRRIQPQGGKLVLAGMKPEVRKIFQLTGFLTIFKCFPSLDEAIESVKI